MSDSRESLKTATPWLVAMAVGTACSAASGLVALDGSMGDTVVPDAVAFVVGGAILGALWPSRFASVALAAAAAGPFVAGVFRGVVHGGASSRGLAAFLMPAFMVIPGLVAFAAPALIGAAVGARLVGRKELGLDVNPRTLGALLPAAIG